MKIPDEVKLCDVAKIIMGQSPSGDSYNREGKGTPLLNGPSEFGQISPVPVQWTTEPTKLCEQGDLLLCVRGNTLGRINIADRDYCIGRGLAAIRADQSKASQQFLTLLIRSIAHEFLAKGSGSTFPNIAGSALGNFHFRLPSLAEQESIAKSLTEQEGICRGLLDAARTHVSVARKLERSILVSSFSGVTPVSIGISDSKLPPGWHSRSLTDLARLESGHTPSRRHPEWWGGEIPWLALPDIRELDGKVALATKERTNELGIANSSARVLPKDTVALSRTASVGFVTIFGREMATSQDFVNWVCGDDLLPRFLMHALRASRDYLVANASGAVHKTLYMPAVKDFHLCLPDKHTQKRIVDQLDEALAARESLLAAARIEREAIEALPAAILRDVFSNAA